jgi:hypothetical protein
MKLTSKRFLNLAIILSVVVVQLTTAARALADDSPPPEETPVVSPTDDPAVTPEDTETLEATPTEELAPADPAADPTEELTPDETVTLDPEETAAADPTEELTPEETVTLAPEETAAADPTEELTPEETETPAPEETAVPDPEETADEQDCAPVSDTEGEVPADGGDAALPPCPGTIDDDITVPISDPMWCPVGAVPGDGSCTPPFGTISELITFLQANPTLYSGDGAIYFQTGDYTSLEPYIIIDYTLVPQLGTLDILGGWDLDGSDGWDGNTGTTVFTVPIAVYWDEDLSLSDIVIDCPLTTGNCSDVGLFVDGGGDLTLENVDSTGWSSGAELHAAGDATVTGNGFSDSEFSDNTNTGLLIYSSGTVTLLDVVANGNNTGIYIDSTSGLGNVNLTNIFTSDNGWTGVDIRSAGDIDLDTVNTTGGVVGANLQTTAGAGNIFVTDSTFAGSSSVGIRAITSEGDITFTNVDTDNGDAPGSFGAWLKSYSGGSIAVTGGVFANAETGLFIVGTADVTLTDVTAENNTGDGAVIESGWVFGCFGPDGIPVTVDGGTYQDNGGFGIVIYPGPNGTGTLAGTIAFLNNTDGDTNIDLEKSCNPGSDEKPAKPYQVVEVSGLGDDPVQPDCETFAGVMMILPDLSQVKVNCPVNDAVTVATVAEEDLPGPLPKTVTLIAGLVVTAGEEGLLPDGGSIRMCFKIPAESAGKHFAILFWDPMANGNLGGWIELPVNQFGGQIFPLHPDTPEDGMLILEGVNQSGDCVCARVNFTGTFVLVAR